VTRAVLAALSGVVLVAFALDAWTTVVAARLGGVEANPLIPAPPGLGYALSVAIRGALAAALPWCFPPPPLPAPAAVVRRTSPALRARLGRWLFQALCVVTLVKLAAAGSNLWFARSGAPALSPPTTAGAAAVWAAIALGGVALGRALLASRAGPGAQAADAGGSGGASSPNDARG